jgi:DNA repair protein RadD
MSSAPLPPGLRPGGTAEIETGLEHPVDMISVGQSQAPAISAPVLRPYQADVIARVEEAIDAGQQRVLLVAPTGSGKTVIAAAIVASALERRQRVLFLAHRRELINQASQKLHALGVDAGIILPGFPMRLAEPVQVASVASLHARAVRTTRMDMPAADIVVVDEAHHCRARTYRRILDAYPNAIVIGLTATPCRGDGRGLGNIFETLIECPDVAELIAGDFLVRPKVYAPSTPDLKGIKVRNGDYAEEQLAERLDRPELVGDIVEHWHKLSERRPTIVYATSVAHSRHLRDEFRRSGVLAEHVDGSTPTEERDAILAGLVRSSVEVVCNCAVLTEGFDAPDVGCLILGRPTKSLGLFRQMIGRGLRPAPGKSDCIILDHAGAVFQHGLPDDPIVWTLSEDRRAENLAHAARGTHKAPALTDCPECHAVRLEGQPCVVCGWRPQEKPRGVQVVDGELVRYDAQGRPVPPAEAEKKKFFAELRGYAAGRGHKSGWAAHKFKERHGAFPPWAWNHHPAAPPSMATLSWIRSRNIAWAKSQPREVA